MSSGSQAARQPAVRRAGTPRWAKVRAGSPPAWQRAPPPPVDHRPPANLGAYVVRMGRTAEGGSGGCMLLNMSRPASGSAASIHLRRRRAEGGQRQRDEGLPS